MPFGGALTLAGIATRHSAMNLHVVALSGALGELIGATVGYSIAATGGREAVMRWGKYVLLRRSDVSRAEIWFQRSGPVTVFVARLLPVVRTFIAYPAGIARMRFAPFAVLTFCGSVPWCYFLAFIGLKFAQHLDDLKRYFHGADAVIAVVLVAAVAVWIHHHLRPEQAETA
jgi:membrane protein DedA with SNARE-associated domain